MLGQILKNTLIAMVLFFGIALVLVFTKDDPAFLVSSVVTFPMLVAVASVAALIIQLIAALCASFVGKSSLAAACIGAILGWLAASGGYQSFGGLGAFSDLIQPAFAISLAVPWVIQAARNSANI